jgi:hypothetical protein
MNFFALPATLATLPAAGGRSAGAFCGEGTGLY